MKNRIVLALSIAAISLVSCKKETTGDNGSLNLGIKASNPMVQLSGAQSATGISQTQGVSVQWTKATASANLIKFEAKKDGSEQEFKSSVQQSIDLFDSNSVLGNINVSSGNYTEVELKALLSPFGSVPALELTGVLNNNGTSVPVIFRATENIELKGEKHNVTIDASAVRNALIALDLSKAVQGISAAQWSGAALTNGTLLITSGSNTAIYNKLVLNIRNLEDESEFH